jgi:hypothetical protein
MTDHYVSGPVCLAPLEKIQPMVSLNYAALVPGEYPQFQLTGQAC